MPVLLNLFLRYLSLAQPLIVFFLCVHQLQARQIFSRVARSPKDTTIEWSEFLAAALQTRLTLTERDLLRLFKRFDLDDTGEITRGDLERVIGDNTLVEEILGPRSVNKNQSIDYRSFVAKF